MKGPVKRDKESRKRAFFAHKAVYAGYATYTKVGRTAYRHARSYTSGYASGVYSAA